jgi:hypothetical protein
MSELLRGPPPYPAVPNPWKAFKSALLVNHEFSNVLEDIEIHESRLTERLRIEQVRFFRMVLSNKNLAEWQLRHGGNKGVRPALEITKVFAGNFWKNFDMLDGSWDCRRALCACIGREEDSISATLSHRRPYQLFVIPLGCLTRMGVWLSQRVESRHNPKRRRR